LAWVAVGWNAIDALAMRADDVSGGRRHGLNTVRYLQQKIKQAEGLLPMFRLRIFNFGSMRIKAFASA
jgi:hypothetical protein